MCDRLRACRCRVAGMKQCVAASTVVPAGAVDLTKLRTGAYSSLLVRAWARKFEVPLRGLPDSIMRVALASTSSRISKARTAITRDQSDRVRVSIQAIKSSTRNWMISACSAASRTRRRLPLDDLFGSSTGTGNIHGRPPPRSVAWHRDVDHEDRLVAPALQRTLQRCPFAEDWYPDRRSTRSRRRRRPGEGISVRPIA